MTPRGKRCDGCAIGLSLTINNDIRFLSLLFHINFKTDKSFNLVLLVNLIKVLMIHCRLTNGTRLMVDKISPYLIEASIMTGPAAGETTFIPRIPLIPSDFPVPFKRLQFPLRVCFGV